MAKDTQNAVNETIGAFKRLREEVNKYKDDLAKLQKDGKQGSKEWKDAAENLAKAQKNLDTVNKVAKGNLAAYNVEQVKTINDLKEKIKLLNQERNAMDMNSKEYADATKQLKVLNDQLREAGTSAGDWKANVGNYANSIKDAFGQLGGAATGLAGNMGGLNASMLKLASNPVGAVVLALVGAIKFLAEGIKSSEENTNKWNEAMVPVKTILTMIQKAAQDAASKFTDFVNSLQQSETAGKVIQGVLTAIITLFNHTVTRLKNIKEGIVGIFNDVKDAVGRFKEWGSGLQKTFEPVTKFVGNIYDGIKEKLTPVIDWIVKQYNNLAKTNLGKVFGLQTIEQLKKNFDDAKESTKEFVEEYNEVKEGVEETTKAENKLGAALRGLTIQRAKVNKELAEAEREYREALEQKDWKTAQEALNKVKEKSVELAKVEVSMRAAEADVIRKQNALTQSTAEAKMAEANATAAVIDAEAKLAEAQAQAAKQQDEFNKKVAADTKAQKAKELAEAVKVLNAALKDLDTNYNNTVKTLETPIAPEGAGINNDSINAYYDAIKANNDVEYQAYVEMTEAKIAELERFIEIQKAAHQDTTTQELQLAALRKEQAEGYVQQYKKMIDGNTKADKDRAKVLKNLQKSELQGYANLFDSVSGLFEQNTVAYKATATAKALISTYLAATGALADTPGGPIARAVAMAATLATGLAQVISIWKVNPKGETSPSTAQPSTPSIAEPVMVDSQPFTYTRTAQTFEEEDQLNQPMFVSVTDINNVQNRVKVVEQESSF